MYTPSSPVRLVRSIVFVAVSLTLLAAGAAATEVMKQGPVAEMDAVHPALMARWHDFPVDLTGDGTPEHLLTGGDGVIHAYAANGSLLWTSDTERLAAGLGLPLNNAGMLFGPFQYLAEPAAAGPALTDLDEDGVPDLVIAMFVALDAPHWTLQSAIVKVSGADGSPMGFDLHDGVVRNLIVEDFTGDGELDLFFTEEDGPAHMNRAETHTIGTGGSFQAHLTTLNGTPLWSTTLPLEWAQATAISVGTFDGAGPDVALAVTASFPQYQAFLDERTTPFGQTLYALDGQTGQPVWQTALQASYAREMHLADMDGDLVDDVILRIQEPRNMHGSFTAGDERARVVAVRGLDGSMIWDRVGIFGREPILHDLHILDGAEPTLVVAYSARQEAPYDSEDVERLTLLSVDSGTRRADLDLGGAVRQDEVVQIALEVSDLPAPAALSDVPTIRTMHMVAPDPARPDRLLVASDRGLTSVQTDGSVADVVWRNPQVQVDRDVFYALGDELWTQDVEAGTMLVYRSVDGMPLREMQLFTLVTAATRVDVDGDGDLDRVAATSGRQVIAFEDTSARTLWMADVQEGVIDLEHEDVDKDGQEDVVVIGRLTIFALDGATGEVLWRHDHGTIGQVSAWRMEDLDGDGIRDLVFGIRTSNSGSGSSVAGTAYITRLDGATGAVVWNRVFAPPAYEIGGLDLGDVDGDGQLDVAFVTQTSTQAIWYHAGVLDGGLGLPLWEVQMPVRSGDNTVDQDGVVFADADGDGDLDVLVGIMGIQTQLTVSEPRIRAHDGRTGLEHWVRPVDGAHAEHLWGLQTAPVGPNGTQAVVVTTDLFDSWWGVTVLRPTGEELYSVRLGPLAFFTDVRLGDVTGDGFQDIVVASPHGLTALDGNATLSGNATFVGHVAGWAASKVHLVDLDDDVALELDFFSAEGNWPLHLGTRPYTDLARGKAYGSADFGLGPKKDPGDGGDGGDDGGGGPTEPVNVPPKASIGVSSTAVRIGDEVTFTSKSSDPDGNITASAWTFSDGFTANGTSVTRTFAHSGTYTATLQVTDDDGADATATVGVSVAPSELWDVRASRTSSWASPGETVAYTLQILNGGDATNTFDLGASAPDGWTVTLTPTTVAVPPGETRPVEVRVVVTEPMPRGEVTVRVVSDSGRVREVDHPVLVPLVLDVDLDEEDGTYHPLQDVTGSLRLHWRDGTPVAGVTVELRVDSGPARQIVTDADGGATFSAGRDGLAWESGMHTLRFDPVMDPYGVYRNLPFRVTATG